MARLLKTVFIFRGGAGSLLGAFLWVTSVGAERASQSAPAESVAARGDATAGFQVGIGGYADLVFSYFDHGPDQTGPRGSPPDRRLVLDLTRLTLAMAGRLPEYGLGFDAELEIEHGGTGSALELEYEEFGEYENDVEKGGKVLVEELTLEKSLGDHLRLACGRFHVAVGLLFARHRPTQYLGSLRAESESTVLPAIWSEMGLEAEYELPWVSLTFQLVNGLDSTGFSSQRWVASGAQGRFETISATAPAIVGRVDVTAIGGVDFGGAVYYARSTTGNRPKPDLEHIAAPLVIASAHWVAELAPVQVLASLVWGRLGDAAAVSEANRSLSNNLDVLRSPVAAEALAAWLELGIDALHYTGVRGEHELGPHLRADWYDTMFRVDTGIFDNPRFARTVFTGGVHYGLRDSVVAKLDVGRRLLGSSDLRPESSAHFSLGFTF